MLHSKQWHSRTAILHEEVLQDSSAPIPAPILQGYPYNKQAPCSIYSYTCTLHYKYIQRILHPEIQFYMQKTKSSSSTTTLQIPVSRNSTHRRQGDLLEMHPCVLQDLPVTFQAFSHKSLQRQLQITPIAPETFQSFQTFQTFQSFQTFRTFQSFMTFQPFQAILQILHCSSISRDSTPFQHSPTRMHILQFLQILQFDWFPQKTPPSTSWAITNITDITFFKEREML